MNRFQALDYYGVEDLLGEEERMIRDTVRGFVTEKILPIIQKHSREGTFPVHLVPEMAGLGLLGANLKGHGCAGLNNIAYGVIMQELERGDSGIRSFVSVQSSLVMFPIHAFGSEEQKNRWLPRLARGEAVGCFGLSEPDSGSDPASMKTRAVPRKDQFILNGTKMWITNGTIADVSLIWARTPEGIRGFLVEKGANGFTARDVANKFSLRASVTSELILEDCEVPATAMLPKATGLRAALRCLDQARYGIAWGAVGSALAVFDEALRYAKTRIQFAKPIASFQLVQEKLVWMVQEITKGQLLCWRLGKLKDAGQAKPSQISLAKRNNVAMALKAARTARDILGASGITDEYQAGRHMCNLESVYTYEGTHDIHTLIIGEDITGIPAYR